MPVLMINGAAIHYEDAGAGDPVVLLHGGCGTALAHWRRQIPVFAERFRVVAPDFRGCGRSSHREHYEIDFYQRDAADIAELIRQLGLAPAHVIGFSDGGIVGLLLAAEYPDLVRSLVALGAQSFIDQQTVEGARSWLPVEQLPEKVQAALARYHGEPYWRQLLVNYVDVMDRILAAGGEVVRGRLGSIRCPTLIMQGEQDPYVALDHARILQAEIPGARLRLFPGCGHEVHREAEAEFNQVVLEFIGSISASAG